MRSSSTRPILAGFDWGARTANIVAAVWPERCKAMVSVSGYLIGSQEAGRMPLPPDAELQWWYQFYFATERGRIGYDRNRNGLQQAHLAARVAAMEVRRCDLRPQRRLVRQRRTTSRSSSTTTVGGSRSPRGKRKYDALDRRLAEFPAIAVPTITLEGDANGAPHPDPAVYAKKFSGRYAHRLIKGGVGHNLPQEAPTAFAQAVIDVDTF
jgi:pimeloyl-ACP methyl ester carboxylesterase